jgi:hypothetical protein
MPSPCSSAATASEKAGAPGPGERACELFCSHLCARQGLARALERIHSRLHGFELGAGFGRSHKQHLIARRLEAPPRVRDPLELGLHLLQPSGLCFERGEEAPQRRRDLTDPDLGLAELGVGLRQLRSKRGDGRKLRCRAGDELTGARFLRELRGQRLARAPRRVGEIRHVQ